MSAIKDDLTQRLMRKAWNADQLRKQKAQIKRTVTAIGKQRQQLDGLLTSDEDKQLSEAARLLDRWAAKAERAFKEKQAVEKAEKQRRAKRIAIAVTALQEQYTVTDLRERIIITCALSYADDAGFPELTVDKIKLEMTWIENNPEHQWANSNHLIQTINTAFNDAIRSLASNISFECGYRDSDVEPVITEFKAKIDLEIDRQRLKLSSLLDALDEWLVKRRLIESAGDSTTK